MLRKIIGLAVLILFISCGGVQGQVSVTYSSGGIDYFTLAIPDNWRVNVGSEKDLSGQPGDKIVPARLISAMPNSGVPLWFGIWVPEDLRSIEDAQDYVASLGLDLLADVAITTTKRDNLNSIEVQFVSGTGNKAGEQMDFKAGFFQLSPDTVAIAIYIGPPGTTLKHGDELSRMIRSMRSLVG